MAICLLFSLSIYSATNSEFRRFERMQVRIQEDLVLGRDSQLPRGTIPRSGRINPDDISAARTRLILSLGIINLMILVLAGAAGYFLAGLTLRPIEEMVDDQNRFITDASHELRTPITVLKAEIEVGIRDKNLNLQKAKKILDSNLEEVNNLQMLSDNLIKLAQSKNGNGSIFENISLRYISEEATAKVKKIAAGKNIKINNNIKDLYIIGDRQSLIELFAILLENAIKYSPSKTSVSMSAKKVKETIEVKIVDHGVGIAKEDLENIFERFYRAEKSRTESGYGLGLSIAKQIVSMHNGEITVESEQKKGSTFKIIFPINKL
jgi:two-component system sensor histidine kinase CiaH